MENDENSGRGSRLSLEVKPERHNLLVDYELVPSPVLDTGAGGSNEASEETIVICRNENFLEDSLESLEVELDGDTSAALLKKTIQDGEEEEEGEDEGAAAQAELVVVNAVQEISINPEELKNELPGYSVESPQIQITPPAVRPVVLYSAPPLQGAPPTYSATMRIGVDSHDNRPHWLFNRRHRLEPSPPFIAPVPPPTYAESQGVTQNQDRSAIATPVIEFDDVVWGPDPQSVVCPNCHNFVITNTHTRRSNLTHFTALTLCICGCWPCCLLPYCIKTCKTIYHECPVCFTVIGMYNPW